MTQYYQGYQLMIFEWFMFGITVPFVLVRLYVEFHFKHRPWREIFTISAILLYMACTVGDQIGYNNGAYDPGFSTANNTPQTVTSLKTFVVYMFCYTTSVYCGKFVLLCFYADLTPRQVFPKTWWLIVIAWAEGITGCLYVIIYEFTICKPFSDLWKPSVLPICSVEGWYYISSWLLHTVSEILVYLIPLIVLRNLIKMGSIKPDDKKATYWMLAFGFFNFSCSIMLTVYNCMLDYVTDINWDLLYTMFLFISPMWQGTTFIIICLPQCRRLYRGLAAETLREQAERRKNPAAACMANSPAQTDVGIMASEKQDVELAITPADSQSSSSGRINPHQHENSMV